MHDGRRQFEYTIMKKSLLTPNRPMIEIFHCKYLKRPSKAKVCRLRDQARRSGNIWELGPLVAILVQTITIRRWMCHSFWSPGARGLERTMPLELVHMLRCVHYDVRLLGWVLLFETIPEPRRGLRNLSASRIFLDHCVTQVHKAKGSRDMRKWCDNE